MSGEELLTLSKIVAAARAGMRAYDAMSPRDKLLARHFNDKHGLAEELQEGYGLSIDEILAANLPTTPKMRRRGENPFKSSGPRENAEGGQSKPRIEK